MASVVMIGGGIVGLFGATLLAQDGHDVTVLERDAAAPPADAGTAWDTWQRKGVNQFHLLHFLLPRFRSIAEHETPQIVAALVEAGALRLDPLANAPESVTGGRREGDERFEILTARRPVSEAAVAGVAAATPGVTVHRGVAVKGLLTADTPVGAPPRVCGVVTDTGGEFRADVVVDAGGRRSALPALLDDIGARAPHEEFADSGFVYYARHFHSDDGSIPPALGPALQAYDSLSILGLPADNGTWGVGVIGSSGDAPLRALKDADTWTALVRNYPLFAHWLDGTPLTGIDVMAKIEDRIRHFVVDGTPVATGVLALGDAWACTNPSVGRGISLGAMHAVALRDLLRDADLGDAVGTALAWDALSEERLATYVRDTLTHSAHRCAQIDAQIAGEPYETDDPFWAKSESLAAGAMKDPDVLRAYLDVTTLHDSTTHVVARPDIAAKLAELGSDQPALPGPSRRELLDILTGLRE